jgi:hypothetical protein
MRDLTKTELNLVSGGQTNSFTGTLVATPTENSITVTNSSGAGLSFALETVTAPGRASTSATVTESNSTP